jgi:hypothetical protein
MKSSHLRYLGLFFVLFFLLGSTLACELPSTTSEPSRPTIIISSPTSGEEFQVGEQVTILSSANDAKGVSRVELYVDGALYASDRSSNPGGDTGVAMIQTWVAEGPGPHTLSVIAVNVDGQPSDPWAVTIRVAGETAPPSASPSAGETPAVVITATFTVMPTETVPPPPPAPTATSLPPTPTLNPEAPLIKYFRANGQDGSYTATPGESVILTWDWERVGAAYLDPGNVPLVCPTMPCNKVVTPAATTTYTLKAINSVATTKLSVTVEIK